MLDGNNVPYTPHELPQEKLGAQESAQLLGVESFLVYKTIVAKPKDSGKPLLAVVPGNCELDVKALADALGIKKVKVTSLQEAERITGLKTGGISPLALINKGFQVVVDSTALTHPQIYISGGQRGINIQLSPHDVIKLCNARVEKISGPKSKQMM